MLKLKNRQNSSFRILIHWVASYWERNTYLSCFGQLLRSRLLACSQKKIFSRSQSNFCETQRPHCSWQNLQKMKKNEYKMDHPVLYTRSIKKLNLLKKGSIPMRNNYFYVYFFRWISKQKYQFCSRKWSTGCLYGKNEHKMDHPVKYRIQYYVYQKSKKLGLLRNSITYV